MSRLLHIECSPRKAQSASSEVARAFLEAYRERRPSDAIDTLDVWATPLPEFDGDALEAKYASLAGAPLTAAQQRAWSRVREIGARFHAADKLLLSMPLWNFHVPYRFKHLIDLVTHKDVLFSFTPAEGLRGLLIGRKAVAIYARGLDYGAASGTPAERFDLQKPYVELWLRMIGVTDVASVIVERTAFGPAIDRGERDRAAAAARELAGAF